MKLQAIALLAFTVLLVSFAFARVCFVENDSSKLYPEMLQEAVGKTGRHGLPGLAAGEQREAPGVLSDILQNEPNSTLSVASPDESGWSTYVDGKKYFRFQYPRAWMLTRGRHTSSHYHDCFVSLNNFGKEHFWLFTEWERGEKPQPVSSKLPPGSVYLDMGWNDFVPGYAEDHELKVSGEMTDRDITGPLAQSSEELREDGQVRSRHITFVKWRRRWIIRMYLREPVSERNKDALNRVLQGFQFDPFPVGDELWATALARAHLPAEVEPNSFPLRGSSGYRTANAEKRADEVFVTFIGSNRQWEPQKRWRYRVTPAGNVIPISGQSPATLQKSEWGSEVGGLQCRVTAPAEIEQGMPLGVTVKLRCCSENPESGPKYLNPFLYQEFLVLSLKNVETQKQFRVRPYSFAGGRPVDAGGGRIPLDPGGLNSEFWQVSFPLVRLRDTLEPGVYECAVEYSSAQQPTRWWKKNVDWESFGFWHGTILSGPFQVKVLKETSTMGHFFLPKRLRLDSEGRVCYRFEDAVDIELPVTNGFFVGTYIHSSDKDRPALCSGTPAPHNLSTIVPFDGRPKYKAISYRIEVFETSDPPLRPYRRGLGCGAYNPHVYTGFTGFRWSPGPGSGHYKVLWKRTFEFDSPEIAPWPPDREAMGQNRLHTQGEGELKL
jgi:hypothetical protein